MRMGMPNGSRWKGPEQRFGFQKCMWCLLVVICGSTGVAQLRQHDTQRGQSPFDPDDGQDAMMVQKRLKALNAERQKSIVSDAQKIVDLTTALDAEVKGMEGGVLTPEQVRKLNQIEKLAHEVKQKMRFTPTGGLEVQDPLVNPQHF